MNSLYRPPNTNPKQFNKEYSSFIKELQSPEYKNVKVVIGMDHNLDFLKSDTHYTTS